MTTENQTEAVENLVAPGELEVEEVDEVMDLGGEDRPAHYGYIGDKANYMRRMRRIEGQARGIAKMIEDEKYCIDILTQISALTGAIQTVATGLLEDHMNHCVVRAARMSDEEAQIKIEEAAQAVRRLVRV